MAMPPLAIASMTCAIQDLAVKRRGPADLIERPDAPARVLSNSRRRDDGVDNASRLEHLI